MHLSHIPCTYERAYIRAYVHTYMHKYMNTLYTYIVFRCLIYTCWEHHQYCRPTLSIMPLRVLSTVGRGNHHGPHYLTSLNPTPDHHPLLFAHQFACSTSNVLIVRRAGLLLSQQDFEWRWSVPLFKCLTVLEFSFILFDLCLLITFFNFIMNYVPIVTFWIFTYHKIWILSIMFCFIWSYWIIYFLACL